jgi:hypothetical protein
MKLIKFNRNHYSTLSLAIFIFLIGISALYTELFHKKSNLLNFPELLKNPFINIETDTFKKITIKNKLNEITFIKVNGIWNIQEPRKLLAKQAPVENILNQLQLFEVKKIFEKDLINLRSFSLDDPLYTIELMTDQKTILVKTGITNTINDSSYLDISLSDHILQTTNLKTPIESMVIAELVEPHIIALPIEQISKVELFKQGQDTPFFSINQNNQVWRNSKQEELNPTKVSQYLEELLKIKSQMILDDVDQSIANMIQEKIDKPFYLIKIYNQQNQSYSIAFSSILAPIEKIKVNKWSSVFVKSDFHFSYIVADKDVLKFFNTSEDRFKGLNPSKLFY